MTREATIKELLLAKGFTLGDSEIPSCKIVTGPNGEIFGHMTANESAARFLDGEDLAPQQVHSTPVRSERAAKPADRLTDVEGVARDAEHARHPQLSPEK